MADGHDHHDAKPAVGGKGGGTIQVPAGCVPWIATATVLWLLASTFNINVVQTSHNILVLLHLAHG